MSGVRVRSGIRVAQRFTFSEPQAGAIKTTFVPIVVKTHDAPIGLETVASRPDRVDFDALETRPASIVPSQSAVVRLYPQGKRQ